jgi:gliding motility-associated-like protein
MKRISLILLFIITSKIFFSQDSSSVQFIENKGQLSENIDYKLPLNAGNIYFEGNCITYNLFEKGKISKIRHGDSTVSPVINGHTYKTHLVGSNTEYNKKGGAMSSNYYNYFIGNNSENWATEVRAYKQIEYSNIYDSINMVVYQKNEHLKYDFIVKPGSNPSLIKLFYEGMESVSLLNGHLLIKTSVGNVIEQSPYAYQLINDQEIKVKCNYSLHNDTLSFNFSDGYDSTKTLIIDPILIFSTYTGSTADNWGFTATYDDLGNMYVGGIAFDIGYPVTLGAFQTTYNGGTGIGYPGTDIAITKFSDDGAQLLYSTYLGGSGNENPHSIVCNQNGELYIFGSTSSPNIPMLTNSYDNSFNLGTTFQNSVMDYVNGTDAFVVKLNTNGAGLLGATYVGGSGNDAVNLSPSLKKNYADEFRGEIIVDNNDNCWVTSTTLSTDFPIVGGAQNNNNGMQDAVAFKLNSDLSSLLWSTYYGGSSDDAGYSIQLNSLNEPIITGGTISNDLFTSSNSINPSSSGAQDGFITKFNNLGNTITAATYIGTSSYDQCYFVQTDLSNNIYVYGQTEGSYPITPSTIFNNPGSGQFIHKLNSDLTITEFSTVFGSGNGINLAPSAFLVSDCDLIYVSGWGGSVNFQGNTFNMPTTSNAYQIASDGSDFFLGVFTADLNSLLYATYFGGNTSAEHVDGGTSRFDKNGKVYQAVCAGCPGNSDFPTSTGEWSNTNNSLNCNLGAFKFSLENITPVISIPQPYVCLPNSYQFNNLSQGGDQYFWDFGDGDTSNQFAPSHTYQDTGHFEVTLIVSDSLGCLQEDTAVIFLDVFNINNAIIQTVDTLCIGDTIQLNASGGATYAWSPSYGLSNPNIATPLAFPDSNITYQVIATDSCGADTALITLVYAIEPTSIMNDTLICFGDIVTLNAYGGTNYNWYPTTGMINPGDQSPNAIPTDTTIYFVDITTNNGCLITDSVQINVENAAPEPILPNDTTICSGDTIQVNILGVTNATWTPINGLENPNSTSTSVYPINTTTYSIDFENTCAVVTMDYTITVVGISSQVVEDTIICPGDTAILWATNGASYSWSPIATLSNPDSSNTLAYPNTSTIYTVNVQNTLGCSILEDVYVELYPLPYVSAGYDIYIQYGDVVELQGQTDVIFYWESLDSMSCYDCLNPLVSPTTSSDYFIYVIDDNGCENSDSVKVVLDGTLYVPNAFSPDGDGINDVFEIKGEEIKSFELWIYNRWGELIFHTTTMNNFWDGRFKGMANQIDVYIWKIKYEDFQRKQGNLTGHVSLIR